MPRTPEWPVAVSRETEERLACFAAMAMTWNRTVRLFAPTDLEGLYQRHVADSLQLQPLIPGSAHSGMDIGSGAGFPGLVLAIATTVPFTLVEADRRKAAFLREAARASGTEVTVISERIETLDLQADLITARAVARLHVLFGWAYPRLAAGGTGLFLKGARAASEIEEARRHWDARIDVVPSRTDQTGSVIRVAGLRPAGESARSRHGA